MDAMTYNKKSSFTSIIYLIVAAIFALVAFGAKYPDLSLYFSLAFFFIAVFRISDKFELNLTEGKIVRKIFGIEMREMDIQSIRRYFVEYRMRYSGYFLTGTHIEVEIFKDGKTTYKDMNSWIDTENIRKMFSEANKINPNIQESSKIIIPDILRKKIPDVYVLGVLLIFFLIVVTLLIKFKLI